MSRPYATDEQYERWYLGECCRCGRRRNKAGSWPDGHVCPGCAGFSQSFTCARCGFEGKLHAGRLCTRCAFADRLTGLLDDGDGTIRHELAPLADALLAMDNPLSGLTGNNNLSPLSVAAVWA